jgi:hypothetical protein
MNKVIPINAAGAEHLAERADARRRQRIYNLGWGIGAPLLVALVGGAASIAASNNGVGAERPGPAVTCAGQGQVAPELGFISAVSAANRDYRLGLSGSEVHKQGNALQQAAGRLPQTNEWVHFGRDATGLLVAADFGSCESAGLPLPAALQTP